MILNQIGLDVKDSLILMEEFSLELDWFLKKLIRNKSKSKIEEELRLSDVIASCMNIGSKKGNQLYNVWKRNKINLLEKLNQEEKEMTIFEKLQNKGKSNTIFDRLEYLSKGK